MIVKDAGYYGNLNSALLDAIPANAALVLEVGCGNGILGAAYKARNAGSRVFGLEIHAASAAVAAGRLDMVICGAAETIDLDFLRGRVDCLVYGDVLEHLLDPWKLLAAHRALLAPGGKVVASIPNVQHWSLLEHLLRGHWTYADHGLLDDTHLRFFTLESIGALFERAGLAIDSTVGLLASPQRAAEFVATLGPVIAALGIDAARLEQTVSPLQFLVSASCR